MKKKNLTYIFILFQLLFIINYCLAQENLNSYNSTLEIGNKVHYSINDQGNDKFMNFEFIVPQDYKNDYRLSVITKQDDFKSDPDVFIHDDISHPNINDLFQKYPTNFCFTYGSDFCYIPQKYLIPGKKIFITVYMQFIPCNFNMVIRKVDPPQMFQVNQSYNLYLQDDDTDHSEIGVQSFTVQLPLKEKFPQANQFKVIALHKNSNYGYQINSNYQDNDLTLQWSLGSDPKTDNFAKIMHMYNIENGVVFQIDSSMDDWVHGEKYSFVVTSRERDRIEIQTIYQNSDDIIQLNIDQKVLDINKNQIPEILKMKEKRTYKINNFHQLHNETFVQKQKLTTIINMHLYFGKVNMYIDCFNNQANYTKSRFQNQDSGQKVMIISANEIDESCKNLYITCLSQLTSSINLEIGFQPQDLSQLTMLPIRNGVKEYGFLKEDELMSYVLALNREKKFNVTIFLTALQGNTDIYVKKCKANFDCTFTPDQLDEQSFASNSNTIAYSQMEGNDIISFQHSEDTCFEKKQISGPNCYYAIIVYNKNYINIINSNDTSIMSNNLKYELLVQLDKQKRYLKENQILLDKLLYSQNATFIFDIGSFDGIKTIDFIVSPISGDPDIFISRTQKNPSFQDHEQRASHWKNFIEYNEHHWKQSTQLTSFYVTIYAQTETEYSIQVQVQRFGLENNFNEYSTQLINGIILNSKLSANQNQAYFDFKLSNSENSLIQFQLLEYQKNSQLQFAVKNLTQYNQNEFQNSTKEYDIINNKYFMDIDRGTVQRKQIIQDPSGFQGYRIMVQRKNQYNLNEAIYFRFLAQDFDKFIRVQPGHLQEIIIQKFSQHIDQEQELYGNTILKYYVNMKNIQEIHYYFNQKFLDTTLYVSIFTIYDNQSHYLNIRDSQHQNLVERRNYFEFYGNINKEEIKHLCPQQLLDKCNIYFAFQSIQNNQIRANNYKLSYLMLGIKNNNFSQNIQLILNKSIVIPVLTKNQGETKYVFYYHIQEDIDYDLLLDIQGEKIYSNYVIAYTDTHQYIENTLQQEYELKYGKNQQYQATNHINHIFYSDKINKMCQKLRQISNQSSCFLSLLVSSQSQNTVLNVELAKNMLSIENMESQFIKGNVGIKSYNYYQLKLADEVDFISFQLSMINNGDANIIVFYHKDDDLYKPKQIDSQALCKEAPPGSKCLDSKNKFTSDEVRFEPAHPGVYTIAIYGKSAGDNVYDFIWTQHKNFKFLKDGKTNKLKTSSSGFQKYLYQVKQKHEFLDVLFFSDYDLANNLELKISICQNEIYAESGANNSQFCDEQNQVEYERFMIVQNQNLQLDQDDLCSLKQQKGQCYISFEFQSHNLKELDFSLLLAEQDEGVSQVVLNPGQYLYNTIFQNQTQEYQLIFYDQNVKLDHFLNVNPIKGNVNIQINPNLGSVPVLGNSGKFYAHLTKESLQNAAGEKEQLNTVTIKVSGCDQFYGCQYGIGVSVEGQTTSLEPGKLYSGILRTNDKVQSFYTKINQQINNNNRQSFLLLTTNKHSQSDVKDLQINVKVYQDPENVLQYQQYTQDISNQQQNFPIFLGEGSPKISVNLITKNKSGFKEELEYSVILQTGQMTHLNLYSTQSQERITKVKFNNEDPDVYVINSLNKGTVLIDLQECSGNFSMHAGQEMIYNFEKNKDKNNSNQILLKVEPSQTYYVQVKQNESSFRISKDTEQVQMGTYSIRALFYEKIEENQIPKNIFQKGEIKLVSLNTEKLTIQFSLPEIKQNKIQYDPTKILASILITDDSEEQCKKAQQCQFSAFKSFSSKERRRSLQFSDSAQKMEKAVISQQKYNQLDIKLDNLQILKLKQEDKKDGKDIYQYEVKIKDIGNKIQLSKLDKIFATLTLTLPPLAIKNMPINNFYNIDVYYDVLQVDLTNEIIVKEQKKHNQNLNSNKSPVFEKGFLMNILYVALILMALFLSYKCVRRIIAMRKIKKQSGILNLTNEQETEHYGHSAEIQVD